ncbi:MAG: hypothetical protein CMJ75_18965 [Planctomycetaceae bacterium]|nr:hypothetical protein [Planctomycetaceae bacterium]
MKVHIRKLPGGTLVPADEEAAEYVKKMKPGEVYRCEIKRDANYKFFKKCHALVRLCFDHFCEVTPPQEYKGMPVEPNYELYRKNMTILAGFYTAHFTMNGDVRLEAKSWSYANMSEEEREKLYSKLIDVALRKVYAYSMTEEELNKMVDEVLHFT